MHVDLNLASIDGITKTAYTEVLDGNYNALHLRITRHGLVLADDKSRLGNHLSPVILSDSDKLTVTSLINWGTLRRV